MSEGSPSPAPAAVIHLPKAAVLTRVPGGYGGEARGEGQRRCGEREGGRGKGSVRGGSRCEGFAVVVVDILRKWAECAVCKWAELGRVCSVYFLF